MVDPDTLQAINAIESLKARYFRSLDTKDWSAFGSVLADDVDVDMTPVGGVRVNGASNYVSALQHDYGTTVTVHHGHMPEIAITGVGAATGTWAVQVLLVRPDGGRLLSFGHDRDTYGIRDGRWVITGTKSTRLQSDQS
ncbi:nuclear transport factor 2 family protein [Nocardia sp. NBC_00565]|uniref:nuclear transport factor 2 family protein n=1 Tax=Nocardia sp. NBC_00565 TaxID=2975993 RepID=UPI002E805CD7|nr:nuclear transport factor 2 family protein [Nocardia sp. NBC_00565]WUC03436.1 nuclear transport factor 2 family protein [Nocardia sp. NBC_00565]